MTPPPQAGGRGYTPESARDFYEHYFDSTDHAEMRYDVGAWATTWLLARDFPPESRVHLDIGCGDGQAMERIGARHHVGLDFSFATLQQCRRFVPTETLLVQASATALPFKDGALDAVSSAHVIEHLADDAPMIAEIARVLDEGGRFTIISPGRASGIPDEEERRVNGHYRRYHGRHVAELMSRVPEIEIRRMERAHRILGAIWNRAKWLFRGANYPIKKWVLRDGRSIFQRPFYQRLLLPLVFRPLEWLDSSFRARDRYFWESETNNYLMVWSGVKRPSPKPGRPI